MITPKSLKNVTRRPLRNAQEASGRYERWLRSDPEPPGRHDVDSGASGSGRADYTSFCDHYSRNLYDFYVELHVSAFVSMDTDDMSHMAMAHMGPQFLPWHRYYLLRLEADMQEVLGDPDFTLPYWDLEDCQADTEDGENPCPKIFDEAFLGSHGSCEDGEKAVTGYLVDEGFHTNVRTEANAQTIFNTDSIRCSEKPLQRAVGCSQQGDGKPPTAEDAAGIYDRHVYDADPYDTCNTDQDVSFRQYLEGYESDNTNALCRLAGCENHGSAISTSVATCPRAALRPTIACRFTNVSTTCRQS